MEHGGVLLLVTPPGAFARVVPFLITAGSLALIAKPWLRGLRSATAAPLGRRREAVLVVTLGLLAVYGGAISAPDRA